MEEKERERIDDPTRSSKSKAYTTDDNDVDASLVNILMINTKEEKRWRRRR